MTKVVGNQPIQGKQLIPTLIFHAHRYTRQTPYTNNLCKILRFLTQNDVTKIIVNYSIADQ